VALGHEQGKSEGMLQANLEGEQKVIWKLLTHRLGPLGEDVSKRLASFSEAQMLDLAIKISSASSLRELGLESRTDCSTRRISCGGTRR
jgi:hypothetical protein